MATLSSVKCYSSRDIDSDPIEGGAGVDEQHEQAPGIVLRKRGHSDLCKRMAVAAQRENTSAGVHHHMRMDPMN